MKKLVILLVVVGFFGFSKGFFKMTPPAPKKSEATKVEEVKSFDRCIIFQDKELICISDGVKWLEEKGK